LSDTQSKRAKKKKLTHILFLPPVLSVHNAKRMQQKRKKRKITKKNLTRTTSNAETIKKGEREREFSCSTQPEREQQLVRKFFLQVFIEIGRVNI